MRVTAITKQRREGRVNLYLDGRFALGLTLDALAAAGLRAGDEIDDDTLRSLRRNAAGTDTVTAALRLLSTTYVTLTHNTLVGTNQAGSSSQGKCPPRGCTASRAEGNSAVYSAAHFGGRPTSYSATTRSSTR